MSGHPIKAFAGSLFGGLAGFMCGALLGGTIGANAMRPAPTGLGANSDPLAQTAGKVFSAVDAGLSFLGMLAGAGIGGSLGAIGGAAIGAMATVAASTAGSAPIPQAGDLTREVREAEIARLRARIQDLEAARSGPEAPAPPHKSPFAEKRPDLQHWQVEVMKNEGGESPPPSIYSTEVEAESAARAVLRDESQAQVFVAGPKGRRYRVLP